MHLVIKAWAFGIFVFRPYGMNLDVAPKPNCLLVAAILENGGHWSPADTLANCRQTVNLYGKYVLIESVAFR